MSCAIASPHGTVSGIEYGVIARLCNTSASSGGYWHYCWAEWALTGTSASFARSGGLAPTNGYF